MFLHARPCILMLLLGLATTTSSTKCDRKLDGSSTPPSPLEGKFWITVATNNRTEIIDQYMPNVRYIVTIEGRKGVGAAEQEKFTRFLLTAENKNDSLTSGTFDLGDDLLTQFSDKCPSAVAERTKIAKTDVAVFWTSPPEGSGCVLIRATVMENEESWFIDEGNLVRTICQNPKAIEDDPGVVLDECCACDEAKYEVTFEGLWSRNTHPKDFPSKGWLIRFSDVIGASHTVDYRFWRYDKIASDGLKQVAQYGSTRKLESELKEESENIRTIIKARGITYPNVTGRTFAVFRVDQKHHLMSLVSMIADLLYFDAGYETVPSPDWIVGVSGLELCLADCTWIEHKELNLYPVDAGTDDGITYTSPDSPTDPPEPIRGITTSYPNDSRSPFYDPTGLDMKPMAKLHLNRQRLYEKTCEETVGPTDRTGGEDHPPRQIPKNKACKTTQWGTWSDCSSTCSQLRQRNFRNPNAARANNCTDLLTDRRPCPPSDPPCVVGNGTRTLLDSEECELSEWSPWTGCSATCGEASETRRRNFIYKKYRKYCRMEPGTPDLQQTLECELPPCGDADFEKGNSDEEFDDEEEDEEPEDEADYQSHPPYAEVTEEWLQNCPPEIYSPWSVWTPCSADCGTGVHSRTRHPLDTYEGLEECKTQSINCTAKIVNCNITRQEAMEICSEPLVSGDCNGRWNRWHFDQEKKKCRPFAYTGCKGNRNNFDTPETCIKTCITHQGSEDGILFNGIPSGNSMVYNPMPLNNVDDGGKRLDCRYTGWTNWSRCNSCNAYTYKTREILVHARNGGSRCPTKLTRKRRCHRIFPNCSSESSRRRRRYRDRKSVPHYTEISADCELSHWSPWSACNASCGESLQHRTRKSKYQRRDSHGKPCTKLVEFRKCSTFPCL